MGQIIFWKREADSDDRPEKTLNRAGVRPLRPRIPSSYYCAPTGLRDFLQRRVVDRHLGQFTSVKRTPPSFWTYEKSRVEAQKDSRMIE
ncbi:hypothetical protein TSAR_002846, partial [Trichomalopsis sarcophagae]